jgi:Zn-dependent M28 family amino/carboxypeptidase
LADRVVKLESIFHEAGCDGDHFREQPVKHSKAPNLICTLPGAADSEIVVGGHVDSIEEGMGAVDDWSGAVLLPSLYESLKNTPHRHRFVFVGFAGEESGLHGSSQFVKELDHDGTRRIHAMINLECLGLGEPEVWVSRADKRLLEAYSLVTNSLHVQSRGMNVDRVGDDDSHPFMNARIPVLTIHSVTSQTLRILHTPADNLSAIDPRDYYTTYRLTAAYLAYLDTALE